MTTYIQGEESININPEIFLVAETSSWVAVCIIYCRGRKEVKGMKLYWSSIDIY
jgi:hypothetical protein